MQENQLKHAQQNQYTTNDINKYSQQIKQFYTPTLRVEREVYKRVQFVPTSHNTPIRTAIASLRNIKADKYLHWLDQQSLLNPIVNPDGVFINTPDNRKTLFHMMNLCETHKERHIIEGAIYGIISNYGDSIYIANDYLCIDHDKVILANYPDKASNREIERCRVAAYALLNGNYPLLLDNDVEHEGEANIKFLPAKINNQEQICLSYESSRSTRKSINNINQYMKLFNLPTLKDICLYPRKDKQKMLYHFDCVSNFFTNETMQHFSDMTDFYDNYKPNGTAVINDGLTPVSNRVLKRWFNNVVEVDDPLGANMIMSQHGIVGCSDVELNGSFQTNPIFMFKHPSTGGGGAHKCCSNVMKTNPPLQVEDWVHFLNQHNIPQPPLSFINGVKTEIERIQQLM